MIDLCDYQKADYEKLTYLHESNDVLFHETEDTLPKIGYIAYSGCIPVAAGFLRMVEGGYSQIDSLVTNKDLPSEFRQVGLAKIVDQLINTAKQLNLKGIIAHTTEPTIVNRAIEKGWQINTEYITISVKL